MSKSSSDSDDEIPSTIKKKRSSWRRDGNLPIPLKTKQRWESKISQLSTIEASDQIFVPSTSKNRQDENLVYDALNVDCNDDDGDDTLTSDDSVSSTNSSSDESDEDLLSTDEEETVITTLGDTLENVASSSSAALEENEAFSEEIIHHLTEIYHDTSKPPSIKLEEAITIFLDFYVTSKLKLVQVNGFLNFMQLILPQPNLMPKSTYSLFNYVKEKAPSSTCANIKHYYCSNCLSYFGELKKKCSKCNNESATCNFFFEFDILGQLKNMFENEKLAEKLSSFEKNSDVISDISDGSEYKRVNNRPDRGNYDLTLILNTDGLSLSNSSSSHSWPLFATIAELPEYIRESHILVLGLWFDTKNKPDMNVFLRPFCLKLQACYGEGIHWLDERSNQVQLTKVVAPLIIADAPARSSIQNILNFNGKYGCNLCEIETKTCTPIEGIKNKSVYLYEETAAPLRTGENMMKQASEVQTTHVKGVKGPSIISILPLFDLGTCFVPEYMHSVLLGVVKHMTKLWLENKSKWNISRSSHEIDLFLKNIKPPHTFNRMPRPITSSYKQYKASEFLNWLLYYSVPVLQNILTEAYHQHWMLLVVSIYNLLKKEITKKELQESEKMLNLFVKQFEELYGDRPCTYNIHQLVHLTLCVERWGPLWATSAFPFENFNGVIAKCVHGTKHLGQEIAKFLMTAQGVQTLKRQHIGKIKDSNKQKKNCTAK